MKALDSLDVTYLITVLAVNGLGFFIVVICYAQIYFSLGTETRTKCTSSGEMTVAKKMALLVIFIVKSLWLGKRSIKCISLQVFTNFACWAPIAFFGLTALAGYPLIDVPESKILLVFFYPINSCANPYLYAILTAQFRRDLFLLLSKFGMCTERAQKYKMNFSSHTNTIPLNQIPHRGTNGSNHHYRRSKSNPNEGQLLSPDNENVNGKTDDVHVWQTTNDVEWQRKNSLHIPSNWKLTAQKENVDVLKFYTLCTYSKCDAHMWTIKITRHWTYLRHIGLQVVSEKMMRIAFMNFK